MDDTVTVVARVRAAKGKGDALGALLVEQAGVVRKAEPGCLAYRVHRSTQDPDLFLFYDTAIRRTSSNFAAVARKARSPTVRSRCRSFAH